MSSVVDALFQEHPAREKLRQVSAQYSEWKSTQDFGADQMTIYRAERTERVLEYTLGALEGADPALTGLQTLDGLIATLDGLLSTISQLKASGVGHLKQVWNHAEALAAQIPRIVSKKHSEALEAFGAVTARLEGAQSSILQEATDQVAAFDDEVRGKLSQSNAQISGLQATSDMLQRTLEQLQQQIGQQNARIDAALAAFTTSSAELEQRRESRYQEWVDKQTENIGARSAEEIAKVTALLATTKTATDSGIANLQQTETDAKKILNVVGNIGSTGKYQESANSNTLAANWLRGGAIALFLVMVGVVIWLADLAIKGAITWEIATFRLISILILALPAAYLARESSRHRDLADRMRRMELELASIDAFNALLPKDEQDKIKAEMARKYFGNVVADSATAEGGRSLTTKEVLKEIREMLRALKG